MKHMQVSDSCQITRSFVQSRTAWHAPDNRALQKSFSHRMEIHEHWPVSIPLALWTYHCTPPSKRQSSLKAG